MIWPWRRRRPDSEAASAPTGRTDRLIVQQHDPRQTVTIGGIDTCMRGILDYAPSDETLALVGIDVAGRNKSATVGPRPLAQWQRLQRGGRDVWFLPIARIDTSQPKGFPRDPAALADAIRAARYLDRTKIADAVAALSAPRVVQEVFFPPSLEATVELPTGGAR